MPSDHPVMIAWLESHNTACPAQWSGETTGGDRVYIRYRFGCLSAWVGGELLYCERVGREYHGEMSDETMRGHLANTRLLFPDDVTLAAGGGGGADHG